MRLKNDSAWLDEIPSSEYACEWAIWIAVAANTSAYSESVPQAYHGNIYCEGANDYYDYDDGFAPSTSCIFEFKPSAQHNEESPNTKHPDGYFDSFLAWAGPWFRRLIEDPIALFTAILTIFNIGLWRETRSLAKGTKDATELTTKEFVATHRPRLRVRTVQTDGIGQGATITVANVGETRATITRISGHFTCKAGNAWPWGRPELRGGQAPPVPILAAGTRDGYIVPFTRSLTDSDRDQITQRAMKLFIVGIIVYCDDVGISRETGFLWEFDSLTQEFIMPSADNEYNYED